MIKSLLNHKRLKLILFLIFIALYSVIFFITEKNKNYQIKQALDKQIDVINIHRNIMRTEYRSNTLSAYKALSKNDKVIDIFKEAYNISENKKSELRNELKKLLSVNFQRMQDGGATQLHFIFPDNTSFLRMHKPDKFGDNLKNIRKSVVYVNRVKKPLFGFENGRFSHGIRHMYPFFDKKGNYLGIIDITFDSKKAQDNLTNLSKIHTHFVVNKKIFKNNNWNNINNMNIYKQSLEHKDYLIDENFIHDPKKLEKAKQLFIKPLRNKIDKNIALNKEFALFKKYDNKIKVISFIPIKNILTNEIQAYLVSYVDNEHIKIVFRNSNRMNLIFFISLLIIFVFIYRTLLEKENLNNQVKLKTKELADLNEDLESQVMERIGEIYSLNEEIHSTQKEVVFTMGAIGERRSKETGNHVKRVAQYSKIFALKYGMSEEEAELLLEASPMHDIGKIAIPDSILNKPAKFTNDEFNHMKEHSQIGYEMLRYSSRPLLKLAATISYEHHEKWDGSGYPRGLKGKEIDINGRITAIADVFDALGSDRCYKEAWDDEKIFKLFKEEKGKHFEPELVDIFFDNLDEFLFIRSKFCD